MARAMLKPKPLSSGIVAGLVATLMVASAPNAATANLGIGGGPGFVNDSVFPFIAGIESSIQSAFFVQNIGSESIELEFLYSAPNGITIEPSEGQETTLNPGQITDFEFDVTVGSLVPAGRYPITLNLRQVPPENAPAGSTYVPALGGRLVVDVVGASASASISAVSELTGDPAIGNMSLFYLAEGGFQTKIFEERTSSFDIDLVPGNYIVNFDIPNLQRQSEEFSIRDQEELEIVLEIPTIDFVGLNAVPTRDDRDVIQFVELSMEVFNNLRPIEGPVEFLTRIYRDEELVEEFPIATVPLLPEEETLQRATYNPPSGFDAGTWEFEFVLRTELFEVSHPRTARIQSPGLLQSYIQEILLVLATLIIIGLLIPRRWWLILLRRRRKDEEEQATKTKPKTEKKTQKLSVLTALNPANWSFVVDLSSRFSSLKEKAKTRRLENVKRREAERLEASKAKQATAEPKPAKNKSMQDPKVEAKVKSTPVPKASPKKPAAEPEKASKRTKFAFGRTKKDEKDPLSKLIQLYQQRDALESEGARSLKFMYELDEKYVSKGEKVVKRVSGEPYSELEIRAIRGYAEVQEEIERVETPELRSLALREVWKAGRKAQSGERTVA